MKHHTLTVAGLLALCIAIRAAFAADSSDVSSAVLSAVLSAVALAKAEALAKSEASAKAEPLPLARRSLLSSNSSAVGSAKADLSAVGSAKAETLAKEIGEVGYGHKDFVPTPQRPLNFRAGGNGYYPGATPPTEWSEGTQVQVDMKGIYGNPPSPGVQKVWDFADTKSKNSYFMLMCGPVPVGNKLLIQSSAWLYCIGEK